MTEIRVRFAPSPTGYLHIGGARTALSTGFRAAPRRQVRFAHRRHGQSAQYRRSRRRHLRRIALARTELGRRPACRRKSRPVFSKRAHRDLRALSQEAAGCGARFRRCRRVTLPLAARTRDCRRSGLRQNRFRSHQSRHASRHDHPSARTARGFSISST